MKEILDALSSPVWWISVVFAGITINLISAYLKSQLDGHLSKFSCWYRLRTEKQQKEYDKYVNSLKIKEVRLDAYFAEIRQWNFAIYLLISAIFLMGCLKLAKTPDELFSIIVSGFASLTIFISFSFYIKSRKIHQAINQSNDDISKDFKQP